MPATEPQPPGAVFLSYAREDAAAATRIADALRGFGIEVWLDQSDLRGGDAWDSKIRRQIRECTLFVAIISATTQGRGEGYFRREWKLAVERTHDMAVGMPFLIPVVVDETPESAAIVPDEFMKVQWTRLKGAAPTPQFVELVKRLLESPRTAGAAVRPRAQAHAESRPQKGASAAALAGIAAAILVAGAAAYYFVQKKAVPAPAAPAPAVAAAPQAPAVPEPDPKSVAVLPFANMSPDKDNDFFADGIHEDVITSLAKVRGLKVIARSSVMAFRDTASLDLRKVASELGVATLLEGSVRRSAGRVRVTAELINARTSENVWAESYDRDVSDTFAVQGEIAQQIAAALKANLTEGEKSAIETMPTQNREAYDLYLRGHAVDINTGLVARGEVDVAIGYYEGAIQKDPNFALAYTQLTAAQSFLYWFGYLDPSEARRQKAQDAVDAAVRLAPDLPETHRAQGIYAYRVKRDWALALAEFLTAEKGLPNDAELIYWMGLTNRRLGKIPDAITYFERATQLNPKGTATVAMFADTLSSLRRFPQILEVARAYGGNIGANDLTSQYIVKAAFEVDGDFDAYVRRINALNGPLSDEDNVVKPYRMAMIRGDYSSAAKALDDPRITVLSGPEGVIDEPVSLHRALLAFLQGKADEAAAFSARAISDLGKVHYQPRQHPFATMDRALAEALGGNAAAAVSDAQSAFAECSAHDKYDEIVLQGELGKVFVVAGERERAIETLRAMMAGPCFEPPREIRIDPVWSRLKDDSRFEEILASAKPI
jgi:TolB-like protein